MTYPPMPKRTVSAKPLWNPVPAEPPWNPYGSTAASSAQTQFLMMPPVFPVDTYPHKEELLQTFASVRRQVKLLLLENL